MTTRRSFFKRLIGAAAIVALAPQIAFGAPKETFQIENCTLISETWTAIYEFPEQNLWIEGIEA